MSNITLRRSTFVAVLAALLFVTSAHADDPDASPPARHVIHVSVDGLRPEAITRRSPSKLPNFYRLREEGAFTDEARTDADYSNTLPNHTSQLTGRPVLGPDGHHWTKNSDPYMGETLHTKRGSYVASTFDVAHDNGLRTGLYASKSKFVVFDQSYDASNGALDRIGEDDGRDKIDRFVYDSDTGSLVETFVRDMKSAPYGYAFLHLRNPDSAGHVFGWSLRSWTPYGRSIAAVDRLLGRLFDLVDTTPELKGRTVIILTSDHGGGGSWRSHGDASEAENHTIPFYVWGASVKNQDLYALNAAHRVDPASDESASGSNGQPIRNGEAANLALAYLGLPPVPGSTLNVTQDLRTGPMPEKAIEIANTGTDAPWSAGGTD